MLSLPSHTFASEQKLVKDAHYEEIKRQALNNDAKAQYEYAFLHYNQDGLSKKDLAIAFEYFTKAYEQGYADAALALSSFYTYGDCVEIDHVKAYEIMKFGAMHGDYHANYFLAFMYKDGDGVEKDNTHAYIHFIIAQKLGFDSAQYEIEDLASLLSNEEEEKANILIENLLEEIYSNLD